MKKRPLVLVEWQDSHGPSTPRWMNLDDLDGPYCVPMSCRSVGWQVRKTKKTMTLVPHISGEKNGCIPYGLGAMTIPLSAVVSVKQLKG